MFNGHVRTHFAMYDTYLFDSLSHRSAGMDLFLWNETLKIPKKVMLDM